MLPVAEIAAGNLLISHSVSLYFLLYHNIFQQHADCRKMHMSRRGILCAQRLDFIRDITGQLQRVANGQCGECCGKLYNQGLQREYNAFISCANLALAVVYDVSKEYRRTAQLQAGAGLYK